jgi:hypothetical protein
MPTTPATETEVRVALHRALLPEGEGPEHLVDEFWIPRSNERVDVAVVGSTLRAFEIKSYRDDLKRLPRQSGAYARLFDECTVVASRRHLTEAMRLLPDWWGVWLIVDEAAVQFEELRPARRNPALDCETLIRLLWRQEAREALTDLGVPPPPSAGRSWMWAALLTFLDEQGVRNLVARALLERDPSQARIPTRRFLIAANS